VNDEVKSLSGVIITLNKITWSADNYVLSCTSCISLLDGGADLQKIQHMYEIDSEIEF
jgi:hypothetical protein